MRFNPIRKNHLGRLSSDRGITLWKKLPYEVKYLIIALLVISGGCAQLTPQYITASAYEKTLILYNAGMLIEAREKALEIKRGEPNYKEAQKLLTRIDILASRLAERYGDLGEEYEKAGLYPIAADEYKTALKLDPTNQPIRQKLDSVEQRSIPLQEGKAKGVNPESLAKIHYNKGVILLNSKQFAKAIDEFNVVIKLVPSYQDTDKLLDAAKKERDELVNLHLKKGIDYFQKEELESAIKEWELVLEVDPFNKTALDYKARAEAIIEKVKDIKEHDR